VRAEPVGLAVIGAGYWGPNLIRNMQNCGEAVLRRVCDLDVERARKVVGRYSTVPVTDDVAAIIDDDDIRGVAIATPAGTHADLAVACLEAGKDVLIEKPIAASVAEAERILAVAEANGRIVMCDHTFCYTPVVRRLRDMVQGGEVGDVQYFDSVRINLGLIQPDVDVFWDLAPHDLSILDFILPPGVAPVSVSAQGADPIGAGKACVGYLTLPLSTGAIAHAHVNWLSPTKIRTTIVGGSRRTVVWDDLNPSQRLCSYDRGVDLMDPGTGESDVRRRNTISYRIGEMVAPALPEGEALQAVIVEFVAAIRERRAPLTDGQAGLRILKVLEATQASMADAGRAVPL